MGISSNQARFLALTARAVDLEFRTQQICQRRLRLTSELENIATAYNNQISNRQMYSFDTTSSGISQLSLTNIRAMKDTNGQNYDIMGFNSAGNYSNAITIRGDATTGTTALTIAGVAATNTTFAALGLSVGASEEEIIDAALRGGVLTITKISDQFTQDAKTAYAANGTTTLSNTYEVKDWRTLPQVADELYTADDVAAETTYDKTVEEINAQDKKLQLEQTSIEVQYKAITSEKEAVKKILDTNAQASFKYFS